MDAIAGMNAGKEIRPSFDDRKCLGRNARAKIRTSDLVLIRENQSGINNTNGAVENASASEKRGTESESGASDSHPGTAPKPSTVREFPRRWDGRPGVSVVCLHCKNPYLARTDRKSTFCSSACHHASTRGKGILGLERFLHQSHDAAKKIRANGLIAKRIKDGHIVRPKNCELCGKLCRPDACHIDYDLPHVVAFACRSCHMRSHYEKDIEADLIAMAKPYGTLPVHPVAKPKVPFVGPRQRRASRVDSNGLTELQCTQCREWKYIDSFHGLTNPRSKTGRASACRVCVNKRLAAKRSAGVA